MWNIVIWGTGEAADYIVAETELYKKNINIVAYTDSNPKRWGNLYKGKRICPPNIALQLAYDSIVISSEKYYSDIYKLINEKYDIPSERIVNRYEILKVLFLDKFKGSLDTEIIDAIKYMKEHNFCPFNQYVEFKKEPYWVKWDKVECLPYIMFEDKKMYYPARRKFYILDGREVIYDLMAEQSPNSPHIYINDRIKVEQGDVICDAGVCEGNFALKYIEKASKVYLVECDEDWFLPLEKTFDQFKDKVVFCKSFLGRYSYGNNINLDTLIDGRLDFLKMDIEGAEVDALLGAKHCFRNNNVKSSICSYHRHNDEYFLRNILDMYGYESFCSSGYMTFLGDEEMYVNPEFRRGIVYGIRGDK